jgi:hypothetical protein
MIVYDPTNTIIIKGCVFQACTLKSLFTMVLQSDSDFGGDDSCINIDGIHRDTND